MGFLGFLKKAAPVAATVLGGPVAGLAVGAATGMLGGKKAGGAGPGTGIRKGVLGQLTKDAYGPLDQTATYQASRAALLKDLTEAQDADEADLVASGQAGGEMSIARRALRGKQYSSGLLGILRQAESSRRGALAGILGIADAEDANYWRRRQEKLARRDQNMGLLGSAINAGANVAMGGA